MAERHQGDAELASEAALIVQALTRSLARRRRCAREGSERSGDSGARGSPVRPSTLGVLELLRPLNVLVEHRNRDFTQAATGGDGDRPGPLYRAAGSGVNAGASGRPRTGSLGGLEDAARSVDQARPSLPRAAPESMDCAASPTPSLKSRALAARDQRRRRVHQHDVAARPRLAGRASRRMMSAFSSPVPALQVADGRARRSRSPPGAPRAPHHALVHLGDVALAGVRDLVEAVGAVDHERADRAELGEHAGERLGEARPRRRRSPARWRRRDW